MTARKTETPDLAETLAALEWHRKHNYEALKALVEGELADAQARRAELTRGPGDVNAQAAGPFGLGDGVEVAR